MANYAYIHTNLDRATADGLFRAAVMEWFGDRLVVTRAPFRDGGPTWLAKAPGTALDASVAGRSLMPPREDFGFTMSLQGRGRTLAFRSPWNLWCSWAQGCIIEVIGENLGVPHEFDATDEVVQPGRKRYRARRTFRGWLGRNLPKPLSPKDLAYINGHERLCPRGFW